MKDQTEKCHAGSLRVVHLVATWREDCGLEDEVEEVEGPENGNCCGKPTLELHFPALQREGILGQSLKGAESEP